MGVYEYMEDLYEVKNVCKLEGMSINNFDQVAAIVHNS